MTAVLQIKEEKFNRVKLLPQGSKANGARPSTGPSHLTLSPVFFPLQSTDMFISPSKQWGLSWSWWQISGWGLSSDFYLRHVCLWVLPAQSPQLMPAEDVKKWQHVLSCFPKCGMIIQGVFKSSSRICIIGKKGCTDLKNTYTKVNLLCKFHFPMDFFEFPFYVLG